MEELDCQRCGACCCNPDENRAEGFADYVEVGRGERLLRKPAVLQRYATANERGVFHLKLVGPEQRCAALEGALGRRVHCAIYELRPRGCRLVEAGSARCLQYRRERGIDERASGGARPIRS
jgi:Fe-S-cluster containining protein